MERWARYVVSFVLNSLLPCAGAMIAEALDTGIALPPHCIEAVIS